MKGVNLATRGMTSDSGLIMTVWGRMSAPPPPPPPIPSIGGGGRGGEFFFPIIKKKQKECEVIDLRTGKCLKPAEVEPEPEVVDLVPRKPKVEVIDLRPALVKKLTEDLREEQARLETLAERLDRRQSDAEKWWAAQMKQFDMKRLAVESKMAKDRKTLLLQQSKIERQRVKMEQLVIKAQAAELSNQELAQMVNFLAAAGVVVGIGIGILMLAALVVMVLSQSQR